MVKIFDAQVIWHAMRLFDIIKMYSHRAIENQAAIDGIVSQTLVSVSYHGISATCEIDQGVGHGEWSARDLPPPYPQPWNMHSRPCMPQQVETLEGDRKGYLSP